MNRSWRDIEPRDAVDIDLETDLSIDAPLTQDGRRCPWPWEPQQYVNAPLGQYHCGYCGEMVFAGVPHIDYRELWEEEQKEKEAWEREQEAASSADDGGLPGD